MPWVVLTSLSVGVALVLTSSQPRALGLIECSYENAPDPPVPVYVNEAEGTVSYDLNRYKLVEMDIVENTDGRLHAADPGQIFILNKATMQMIYVYAQITDDGKRRARLLMGRCEG